VFFYASKTLDILGTPLFWALALLIGGAVLVLRRRPRAGVAAVLGAAAVLYVFSFGGLANRLMRSLEASAVRTAGDGVYDAVIVLGGLVEPEASESSGQTAYNDSIERLLAAYDLLRTGRARFALLSSGATNPAVKDAVEARVLMRQLVAWGIDPARLVVEDRSRNTRENAVESAAIVRARGWQRLMVVTSAFHMRRAAGCFRAVGLTFDTWPVDYRTYAPERFASSWLPRADHLAESTYALREYIGRAVYRLRGFTVE
jgi:uncharacterized SAM-binding protein YcdF (DUF218 family)